LASILPIALRGLIQLWH